MCVCVIFFCNSDYKSHLYAYMTLCFLDLPQFFSLYLKKIKGWVCYHLQCGRLGFDPWVGKIPWKGKWQPTPVFLPGESHGQRSLAGYSLWDHKESDTTERLNTAQHIYAVAVLSFPKQ